MPGQFPRQYGRANGETRNGRVLSRKRPSPAARMNGRGPSRRSGLALAGASQAVVDAGAVYQPDDLCSPHVSLGADPIRLDSCKTSVTADIPMDDDPRAQIQTSELRGPLGAPAGRFSVKCYALGPRQRRTAVSPDPKCSPMNTGKALRAAHCEPARSRSRSQAHQSAAGCIPLPAPLFEPKNQATTV